MFHLHGLWEVILEAGFIMCLNSLRKHWVSSCWITIRTILLQPNQYLTSWSFYLFPKRTTSHSEKLKPLFSCYSSQIFHYITSPPPNKIFVSHNYYNKYTGDSLFQGEFIQRRHTVDFSDYHSFCSLWKISVLRSSHHLILISDLQGELRDSEAPN